jgi:hypothetical protein
MPKYLLFVLCSLNTLPTLSAQFNFVRNGSFELFNNCPVSLSNMTASWMPGVYVLDWIKPTQSTTDYYHACSNYPVVGVPENITGYQFAHDGDGYCGILTLSTEDTLSNNSLYREYLSSRLKKPLEKGKQYCVSFYVSAAGKASYGINNDYMFGIKQIGMYLSKDTINNYTPEFGNKALNYTPQITAQTVIADTVEWQVIAGLYTAEGGEEWITIGNFSDDLHTRDMVLINTPPPNVPINYTSYYRIDQVQIFESSKPLILPPDMILCPDDVPITVQATPGLKNYLWNTGDTGNAVVVTESTVLAIEAFKDGCQVQDTLFVTVVPNPELNLGPDIDNCLDGMLQTVTLQNSTVLNNYTWSTGTFSPQIEVSEAGNYILSSIDYCGTFSDTIRVSGCESFVYVPNVFAPGITGENARFTAYGSNVVLERLEVYNNWGVRVYAEDNPTKGWDGQFRGEPCPPGVYVWNLTYRPTDTQELLYKHGDVTVVR